RDLGDRATERGDASPLHHVELALANDEPALPVMAAIEHDERALSLEEAERRRRIAVALREADPKYVARLADLDRAQASTHAHGGVAAVAADDEIGAHLERPARRPRAHAHDRRFFDEPVHLGVHAQVKTGERFAAIREETQEIRLWDEHAELAARAGTREIGERDVAPADA